MIHTSSNNIEEGELASQANPQDLDADETEGELASQAPLLPRTSPPLTRAQACTLDHVVLALGLFGTMSSTLEDHQTMVTMIRVFDNKDKPDANHSSSISPTSLQVTKLGLHLTMEPSSLIHEAALRHLDYFK